MVAVNSSRPSFVTLPSSRVWLLSLILLLIPYPGRVSGVKNITVDDNDDRIRYSNEGWDVPSSSNDLNFGGFHHVTGNPRSTASFNFTGTAVYFMSPKWPYDVAAQLSLDSSPSVRIDLRDRSRPFDPEEGPETIMTDVVWGVSGLDNAEHTLLISFADDSDWLVADALIYTEEDEDENPTSSSSMDSSPLTTSAMTTSSSISALSNTSSNKSLSIGLGVGLSVVGVILCLSAFFLFRRRRRRNDEEKLSPPQSDIPKSGNDDVLRTPPAPALVSPQVAYNPWGHTTLSYDTVEHRQLLRLSQTIDIARLNDANQHRRSESLSMVLDDISNSSQVHLRS